MHAPALRHTCKTGTDFHTFDRVDTHHRVGNIGVELVIQGLAQADRHLGRGHADARAARVTGLTQRVHIGFQGVHIGHRREKRVVGHMLPRFKSHRHITELRHAAAKHRAVLREQPLLGHRTGGHHGRGHARRGTSASARVAQAVFLQISEIRVPGAEGVEQVAVVLAALVGVVDQQRNRRAGGAAFEHAAQNLHRVGFVALGHVAAGAGAAAVQVALDVRLRQLHAGRAAVNHTPDCRAVGFSKVGDRKKLSKGISAHAGDYP